ncbi:MAG: hypothetical protein SNF33_04065 [Candidatus Algichlamydia australiensis]|nr:hypothetical protein [Chlamydiales bacterium]
MKRIYFLLLPSILLSSPIRFGSAEEIEGCDLVLSEPRSGVNWLMSCLQFLTRKPLCPIHFRYSHPMNNRLGVDLDEKKPPFIRSHEIKVFLPVCKEKNRLILVFRNYKETTIRECGDSASRFSRAVQQKKLFHELAAKLNFFDRWPEENRHLVYYEDLLLKPKDVLQNLLVFLEEEDSLLEEFIENIQEYKRQCLSSYDKQVPGGSKSISKGKSLDFHSKKVPKKLLYQADGLFQSQYPYLWKKYLSRYKERE